MRARFSRSDAMVERLGEKPEVTIEGEWFQLTYDTLRVAPDGATVAYYSAQMDGWFLLIEPGPGAIAFSDVVIYDEQP